MSWPASSSRAWACGSGPPAGRAVRASQYCGPQRGQHQHRGPGRVPQQLPQPGGDPLAQPAFGDVEVELGLVQPHHGPRPDARQLAQRGIGAGRVDRMPQPPRPGPVPQQAQRLPAGPGLARGGPADQHRDPAAAVRRRPHHRAQLHVVVARHVRRQDGQAGLRVLGLHRPVHLQRERVPHLGQRPPGQQRPRRCLPHRDLGDPVQQHGQVLGPGHPHRARKPVVRAVVPARHHPRDRAITVPDHRRAAHPRHQRLGGHPPGWRRIFPRCQARSTGRSWSGTGRSGRSHR